jgi:hypothetical protein
MMRNRGFRLLSNLGARFRPEASPEGGQSPKRAKASVGTLQKDTRGAEVGRQEWEME